jgi:hypothetical protein
MSTMEEKLAQSFVDGLQPGQIQPVQSLAESVGMGDMTPIDLGGGKTTQPVIKKEENTEAKTEETPKDIKAETPTDTTNSSLNDKVEDKTPETKSDVLDIDKLVAERTEGKFKTLDELKGAAETPQTKFASEEVERINNYISQGGTYDDYVATQTTNFDEMSTRELIEYKLQMEDPDMEDEEIQFEMKKRYGVDKWKDKSDEYEDGIEPDDIRIAKIRFNREALKTRDELKSLQQKWATPKAPTKEQVEAQKQAQTKSVNDWNLKTDSSMNDFNKVSVKVTDNESSDYTLTPTEKKEVADIVKGLYSGEGMNKFWNQFVKDGNVDQRAIADMMFKYRNFDKAVKNAYEQARAKGAETVVKDLKNTDMKPDTGKSDAGKVKSVSEQMSEQFVAHQTRR